MRFGCGILAGVIGLAGISGCAQTGDRTHDEEKQEEEEKEEVLCDRYDRKTYLSPFWEGDTIVNETIMFVGEEGAPLLYEPTEILSVRSYGLNKVYEEGKDYEFREGKLYRIEEGQIPYFTLEEYYPATMVAGETFPVDQSVVEGHSYIKFGELDTFCSRQIAVTYRHSSEWEGYIPTDQSEKIASVAEKLSAKETLNMVFYGDSITTGANSSGVIGSLPNADSWPQMVSKELESRYGVNINEVNTAVGGTTTAWGLQNVEDLVCLYDSDLVVLGFGMNDISLPAEQYKEQILGIISAVRERNPEAAFVLVSPMLPNREVAGFYGTQPQFEAKLCEIAQETENCAVAEVTTMHRLILERKRYFDMTGNNVNHPNDFLARVYAQTILAAMGETEAP